jgi:hypothetical protein
MSPKLVRTNKHNLILLGFTSNTETSTYKEESKELENDDHCDDGKGSMWSKIDKKLSDQYFQGNTGLNIIIDNPETAVEVVSAITGDLITAIHLTVKLVPRSK